MKLAERNEIMTKNFGMISEHFGYGFRKTGQKEEKILAPRICSEQKYSTIHDMEMAFGKYRDFLLDDFSFQYNFAEAEKKFEVATTKVKSMRKVPPELISLFFRTCVEEKLIDQYNRDQVEDLCIFASALCNKVKEKTIVFDIACEQLYCLELRHLGYGVKDKLLVCTRDAGDYFGADSSSKIISLSGAGECLGGGSLGVVSYGSSGERVAASAGFAINLGNASGGYSASVNGPVIDFSRNVEEEIDYWKFPQHGDSYEDRYINEPLPLFIGCYTEPGNAPEFMRTRFHLAYEVLGDFLIIPENTSRLMPKLCEYLINLRADFEKGRHNPGKAIDALEKLGDNPGQRIRHDITKLLCSYEHTIAPRMSYDGFKEFERIRNRLR